MKNVCGMVCYILNNSVQKPIFIQIYNNILMDVVSTLSSGF